MVTVEQETRGGMMEAERGDKRMLRAPCCKCHFVPFTNFSEYSNGHSRCRRSCHFLSHPLTFGILGSMPCAGTGSWIEDKGVLYQPRAQWKRWLRTIIGHHISTREYFCHWTHVSHFGENPLNSSCDIFLKDKVVMQ